MNIPGMSTGALLKMLEGIRAAVRSDLNNPEKRDPYYGVNDYADWKVARDLLQQELDNRKATYEKVTW